MIRHIFYILSISIMFFWGCNYSDKDLNTSRASNSSEKTPNIIKIDSQTTLSNLKTDKRFYLSSQSIRNDLFKKHLPSLPKSIVVNYDKYSQVRDLYVIVEILSELQQNPPSGFNDFYFYVLWQIAINENIDGFAGDEFSSTCLFFLENSTYEFYIFLDWLFKFDNKSFLIISDGLAFELANSKSNKDIRLLFEKHRKENPNVNCITNLKDYILNYK